MTTSILRDRPALLVAILTSIASLGILILTVLTFIAINSPPETEYIQDKIQPKGIVKLCPGDNLTITVVTITHGAPWPFPSRPSDVVVRSGWWRFDGEERISGGPLVGSEFIVPTQAILHTQPEIVTDTFVVQAPPFPAPGAYSYRRWAISNSNRISWLEIQLQVPGTCLAFQGK